MVWTLHDCWTYTGHCAYFSNIGCEKWKTQCFRCPLKYSYPKSLFFDNSVLLKMKLADMFIDSLSINVDRNLVLTACLVYGLNKLDTIGEKERIKRKKREDYLFLNSLGFNERFCKICTEYNRVNETKKYQREEEGDILELVENFGGMLLHREERLAYSVSDALDLLQNKNLAGKNNKFLEDFKLFVDVMQKSSNIRLITDFQKRINKVDRNDISSGIRAIYDNQDVIENTFLGTENELFEEQVKFFKILGTIDKICSSLIFLESFTPSSSKKSILLLST